MGNVTTSNDFVRWVMERIRSRFNSLHEIRLFVNPLAPAPSTPLAAFGEATFPGYAPASLTGRFPVSVKIQDGEYQITPMKFSWTPTADSPQTVVGWYLFGFSQWCLAGLFPSPVPVVNGQPIELFLAVQSWGLDVLCP